MTKPPKAQGVSTPLNAQAKGLTKRLVQDVASLERGAGPSRHGTHRRSKPQNATAFPANLSGKADSEGLPQHVLWCNRP